eukprot:1584248-Amphidinium_carterae.1
MQQLLRSPGSVQELLRQLSSDELTDLIKKVLTNFTSKSFSEKLLFSPVVKTGPVAEEDAVVAQAAFDLMVA